MRRAILTLVIAATLSGCAYQRTQETFHKNETTAETATNHISAARAERPETVSIMQKPWVSHTPIPITIDKRLPPALSCKITFAPVQAVSIFEFGQTITSLCGIPVRVTKDAVDFLTGSSNNAAYSDLVSSALPPLPPLPAGVGPGTGTPPIPLAENSGPTPQMRGNAADLAHMGLVSNVKWQAKPVSGLLDVVTSRLGLSWRYTDGIISIYYLDTRVFRITAISSKTTMTSTVASGNQSSNSGNSSGGSGNSGAVEISGGSNQNTEVAISTHIVADIEKTLKSMLTPLGKLAMSFSTGSVTVTDTPEVLDRIGAYLKAENASLRRMVRINVDMLVVTLDASDRFGIDWNVVYKQLAGKYGAGLMSNMTPASDSVVGSFGILDTAKSEFSGTKLLFEALSKQGTVSVVTTPTINTLNLQPAPLQIAEQQYFVKNSSTTNTPNVGSTSSLELGTITTGFNANVLPFVIDSDNLILQFTASISPRAKIREVSNGLVKAEAPETSSRTFSQQVALRSGQTVVLSGYEQTSDTGGKSGVGEPGFMALGGGFNRTGKREVLVILITPVIADPAPMMTHGDS